MDYEVSRGACRALGGAEDGKFAVGVLAERIFASGDGVREGFWAF